MWISDPDHKAGGQKAGVGRQKSDKPPAVKPPQDPLVSDGMGDQQKIKRNLLPTNAPVLRGSEIRL